MGITATSRCRRCGWAFKEALGRFIFSDCATYTFHRTNTWGVLRVKGNMEERAVRLAQYIIENRATVRAAAAKFGVSKSTVHMEVIN